MLRQAAKTWRRLRKYYENFRDFSVVPWDRRVHRVYVVDDEVIGQGELAKASFEAIGLDDWTTQMFFRKFCAIDKDNSGEISLQEFYRFFHIPQSAFSDRVFKMLDVDGSGEIDFREFVLCIWNFCTYTPKTLITFAFSLYDTDNSKSMEMDEVRHLVDEVYGDHLANNVRVQRILDVIDDNGDGVISFTEFCDFNQRYPALLFPAYKVQQQLRIRIFGDDFWDRQTGNRSRISHGRNMSIFELLEQMDRFKAQQGLDQLIALNEEAEKNGPSNKNHRHHHHSQKRGHAAHHSHSDALPGSVPENEKESIPKAPSHLGLWHSNHHPQMSRPGHNPAATAFDQKHEAEEILKANRYAHSHGNLSSSSVGSQLMERNKRGKYSTSQPTENAGVPVYLQGFGGITPKYNIIGDSNQGT